MLDQDEPRPPCAGPLGPAYVQRRYLLEGSAPAWLPAGEETVGEGGRGRENHPQVRRGLRQSWGLGRDSSFESVFISSFKLVGVSW